jgi:hypothetical protein
MKQTPLPRRLRISRRERDGTLNGGRQRSALMGIVGCLECVKHAVMST